MRVLFLNHNVVGSGTFFRAYHFGRHIAARGHQVTLVTTSRGSLFSARAYEHDGIEMIEAPDLLPGRARTGWDPYNTLVRCALVRRRSFDVVHAFDSRPAVIYPALAAAAQSRALFVMDWADWWGRGGWIHDRSGRFMRTAFGPIETWFEEAFRLRAHGMTVISRALGARSEALGIAPERIRKIPFGYEAGTKGVLGRARAREVVGVSEADRILVHVGVLTPGDYALLCAAFARVRAQDRTSKLVLAGRTGIRLARKQPPGVYATGALSDDVLEAWVSAADACVIASNDTIGNRGRWPSKLNTYLRHGRAVVMTRVGDAAEFVQKADAGWVTEPTAPALAEGMLAGLRSAQQGDEAGARGRAAAERELAWPRLTDELLTFYDTLGDAR